MFKKLSFFEAVAIVVGTIIGAGMLSLPYVIARAGFLTGLADLIIIAAAILLFNLMLGEVVLSTKGIHQLTGYAEKYLGRSAKFFMLATVIFGYYGALLAYLIGEGQVLAALTGGSAMVYSLIFFIFASLLVYAGLNMVKRFELLMTLVIFIIVLLIAWLGWPHINWDNLAVFDWRNLLIPYGVIFFAMSGSSAIPQLKEALSNREKLIPKAIIVGHLIPFFVYLLFTFTVIGISGLNTSAVATVGLGQNLGRSMVIFGNLFAFFAMATSFLTLGLALKATYQFDFKIKHFASWALACLVPLILLFLGINNFVGVIEVVGAVGGGLQGLLILFVYFKMKSLKHRERTPEYQLNFSSIALILLAVMFIGGLIYTLGH